MWTLQPFAYLFNQYWSSLQSVTVVCESRPTFGLPNNFRYYQVGLAGEEKWPQHKWSDGLMKFLHSIDEQYVLLMLDDYWLVRTVDHTSIGTLLEYMKQRKNILRIDLTGDRLYAAGVEPHDMYGHYDLIKANGSEYQMSLMPGIWNKGLLLSVLELGWSPWDVELRGTSVVNERPELVVLGTRQWPIRITNALRTGNDDIDVSNVDGEHLQVIQQWFPK